MTTPSNISSRWFGIPPYTVPPETVMNYGAAGDGLSDDTPYIQAAMAALISNGAPTSGGRNVKAPLIFPPGTYKVSSDLLWQSVNQPVIMGYGATLVATGTAFSKAVLNLDGAYRGIIAGLTIIGDGTEQVTSALKIDDSTAGFRTTTGCKIEDINIRNLNYVNGIDLIGTTNRQLDGTQVNNVLISGQQSTSTWSNTGNWQNGIAMGDGTFANIYNNALRGVSCSGHWVGYNCNASSFSIDAGQPANNNTDFLIVPGAQCVISNVQSQNCGLHFSVTGFSPLPVTFNGVQVKSNFITDAGGVVGKVVGGPVIIDNFSMTNIQINNGGTFVAGVIKIQNDGSSQRYGTVSIRNLMSNGLKTAAILPTVATGAANIVVENYMNYNPSTGLYTLAAGDVLSTWNSGASTWNSIV